MSTDVVDRGGSAVAPCERREACAACGATALHDALIIPRVPVYMGCTTGAPTADAFADQQWVTCERCGSIQLRALPPLALVYQAQHNAAIGGVWARHHAALADFIAERAPRRIVEIGGSTGTLAHAYVDGHDVESWTVIEPNPTFEPEGPIDLVEAFVEDVPEVVRGADAIVHSHLLEHLYHPRALLRAVRDAAAPDALMVLSVPDLPSVLGNSGSNALNFEHTYFFGIPTLLWMLADAGFELDALRRFERHSVHVQSLARGDVGARSSPPDSREGAEAFSAFVSASRADAEQLADRAARFDGDVYLFGGHVFSQFLLVCGFPAERAAGVLDNDPAKQGLRLYGTDLVVRAPAHIAAAERVAVVVRAAHYTGEISAQLRDLSPTVEIW